MAEMCFTSRGEFGAKLRKARFMKPKQHAGGSTPGKSNWKMNSKKSKKAAPPPKAKKERK